MFDASDTLAMLHYGDSAYPAGGFAFSWGVEGLAADGYLAGAKDLDRFVAEQLHRRWAIMDRILLLRAYLADDLDAVASVDRLADASTPSAQMREGSRRAGKSMLGVSGRLGGPLSTAYRARLGSDPRLGHLPVAQALSYRDAGLGRHAAQLVSGWTLVTGLLSAAVRLGLVGFIDAQHAQSAARADLTRLLAVEPDPQQPPASFTPLIDIAVTRGPARHIRMFST